MEPEFNFGAVRKSWRTKIARLDAKINRYAAKVDVLQANPEAAEDEIEAAWDAFEAVSAERDTLLGQVIVDVPRAWLADDAPPKINWQDEGALEFVRPDYLQKLMDCLTERLNNPAGKSVTPTS